MTRSLVKSLEPDDYLELREGTQSVERLAKYINGSVRIDIPHPNRYWEYGSAVQAFLSVYGEQTAGKKVLDIGSGWSPLGPTLSYCFNVDVTECEPDIGACSMRAAVNAKLAKAGKPELKVHHRGFGNLVDGQFDAVFCISVIEHLPVDVEDRCWREMADRVKPTGLLFLTADCVEHVGKPYVFDNLRVQNFTAEAFRSRVEKLKEFGFTPMGRPDYRYHGATVHDYTFYRLGFIRTEASN